MPVQVMRSTDSGLPTLTWSAAGAVAALFDMALVNGYNSQTGITVTRTGSVATYTKTAHGFGTATIKDIVNTGVIVQVTGFTQPEYNVTGQIFSVTANTWQMNITGTPATPGTTGGTTTAKRPPLMWAGNSWGAPYTGTNQRVFTQPTGSNGFSLYIDDSRTRAANQCDYRAYEVATGLGTGTGQFPSAVQAAAVTSTTLTQYITSTISTASNGWLLVSNGKLIYFFAWVNGVSQVSHMMFGDGRPLRSGDQFFTMLSAAVGAGQYAGNSDPLSTSTAVGSGRSALYAPRPMMQYGSSVNIGMLSDTQMFSNTINFPNDDGNILFLPWYVHEGTNKALRGTVPGFWAWAHPTSTFVGGDQYPGTGAYAGRVFEGIRYQGQSLFIEISDTWDV